MFNILFTAVGRRVELIQAFINSFENHRIPYRVVGTDCNPELAPACVFTSSRHQVPRVNEENYVGRLLDICRSEQVDLLIPLFEPEFMLLDAAREQFAAIGTRLLLSGTKIIELCQDKYQTYHFFKNSGFKTPQTWLGRDEARLELPAFVKPRDGMGSHGAQKVKDLRRLEMILDGSPEMIIQEYINGTEYTLDILNDFNGKALAVIPRERLEIRGGEVSKSRTVRRDDLIAEGRAIAETLGAVGPITVQCIDTGKDVYWIEINPRFGGGVPLSIRAGVDYPYLLYCLSLGQMIEPFIGQFQDGLTMIRYDQAIYF